MPGYVIVSRIDFVVFFCLRSYWGRLIRWSAAVGQVKVDSKLLRVLLAGSRGPAFSCLLCSSTRLCRPFPRAKSSFGARGALVRFIVAVVALDLESRQSEHSKQQQRCCNKVIDHTHSAPAIGWRYVLLAGGEQGVPRWLAVSSSSSSSGSSSSQASIGAVVGCNRVFFVGW